jgi:23S rRNA (uracil1939-C5)-methyltransferase
MPTGIIESLDHEARGVTRLDGKTVFVEGALPGECVEYASYRRKPSYELARTLRLLKPSPERVTPRCPHFGVCGGCSMQHLDRGRRRSRPSSACSRTISGISAGSRPNSSTRRFTASPGLPLSSPPLGTLCAEEGGRARRFPREEEQLRRRHAAVRNSAAALSAMLLPLRELIGRMSIRDRLPQIEVAVGERMTALVLRILEALDPADEALLRDFADRHAVVFYLQPQGPATAYRFYPLDGPQLSYLLPDFRGRACFLADRVHSGQSRDQPRAGAAGADPARAATGRAHRGHVLWAGQLHAADCPLGGARARCRGQPRTGSPRHRERAANGLDDLAEYRVANLFETTPESWRPSAASTGCSSTRRAKALWN